MRGPAVFAAGAALTVALSACSMLTYTPVAPSTLEPAAEPVPIAVPTASVSSLSVVLDIEDVTGFLDSTGAPVTITADDGADAMERHVSGTLSDGSAASITVFRGSDWMPTDHDLVDLGTGGIPQSQPESDVPILAYASTQTTLSVATRPVQGASGYRLTAEQLVLTSDTPSFTLTGLAPGFAYDVVLTADGQPGFQYALSLATLG